MSNVNWSVSCVVDLTFHHRVVDQCSWTLTQDVLITLKRNEEQMYVNSLVRFSSALRSNVFSARVACVNNGQRFFSSDVQIAHIHQTEVEKIEQKDGDVHGRTTWRQMSVIATVTFTNWNPRCCHHWLRHKKCEVLADSDLSLLRFRSDVRSDFYPTCERRWISGTDCQSIVMKRDQGWNSRSRAFNVRGSRAQSNDIMHKIRIVKTKFKTKLREIDRMSIVTTQETCLRFVKLFRLRSWDVFHIGLVFRTVYFLYLNHERRETQWAVSIRDRRRVHKFTHFHDKRFIFIK